MKFLIFLLLLGSKLYAQLPPAPDSLLLLSLNQRIDDLVVEQKVKSLDSLYADDFVFSHGSGKIEGKAGWMKTVGRTKYQIRRHDSVTVEQHKEFAILKGAMYIERKGKSELAKYWLKYVRVFVIRERRWQLVSHNTVYEEHL